MPRAAAADARLRGGQIHKVRRSGHAHSNVETDNVSAAIAGETTIMGAK